MSQNEGLVRIHLGCGKRSIPGLVHVDQVAFPHVDHVVDLRDLSVFADASASLVYACQVLEYFDADEVGGVLNEWSRVLAPGGILRLSVPNFRTITDLYAAGLPLDWFIGTLFGKIPDGRGSFVYHRTTRRRSGPSCVRQALRPWSTGIGGRPSMRRWMTSRRRTSRTWRKIGASSST